eukprot:2569810-Pyramimonas_sp.AAC.1
MSVRCSGKGGRARTQTHLWCRMYPSRSAPCALSPSQCAKRCGGCDVVINAMANAGAAMLG